MDCFIGIDVSKATLDLAALPDGESWTVTNDEHGLAELAPRLVSLAPVLAVMEATGGFEMLAGSWSRRSSRCSTCPSSTRCLRTCTTGRSGCARDDRWRDGTANNGGYVFRMCDG